MIGTEERLDSWDMESKCTVKARGVSKSLHLVRSWRSVEMGQQSYT